LRGAASVCVAVAALLACAAPAFAARTEQASALEAATLRLRADTPAAFRAARPELRRLRSAARSCLPLFDRLPDEAVDEAEALLFVEADRVVAIRLAPVVRRFVAAVTAVPAGDEPILDATRAVWSRATRQLDEMAKVPDPAFCPRVRSWLRDGVGDVGLPVAGYRFRSDLSEAEDLLVRASRRLFQLGVKGEAARMWRPSAFVRPLGAAVDLTTPHALTLIDGEDPPVELDFG
jgi:hypothetical protein